MNNCDLEKTVIEAEQIAFLARIAIKAKTQPGYEQVSGSTLKCLYTSINSLVVATKQRNHE